MHRDTRRTMKGGRLILKAGLNGKSYHVAKFNNFFSRRLRESVRGGIGGTTGLRDCVILGVFSGGQGD